MSRKRSKRKLQKARSFSIVLLTTVLIFLGTSLFGAYHYVRAYSSTPEDRPVEVDIGPNFGVRTTVEGFFKDNDAEAMLPIIKCESHFRHYEQDGSILKNKEGSSAIGVAQILSSKHPDPKIIYRYNKRNNTDFTVDDFDITTLEGNIGYALVLFKVRGTKDWECSHRFRF